jgi:hypothetical protein
MLSRVKYEDDLEALADRVKSATAPTSDLFYDVRNACPRLRVINGSGKVSGIDRFIEAGAWYDAALALIAVEIPAWSIRRLIREDGEWFCSLTREPNLPLTLDDTVDVSHQSLPLAIIGALLQVRRRVEAARVARAPTVPHLRAVSDLAICCDNFR